MLWHIVRFRFPPTVDDATRRALERDLARLGEVIDEVQWLAVARDVEDTDVTGLLTLFADEDALGSYRVHPEHTPIVERARRLCDEITRLDVEAGTPP
jgi:hypothetical protein